MIGLFVNCGKQRSEKFSKLSDMETCSRENEAGSKCTNELDTTGSPTWCKACRAKYQRQYQDLRKQLSETRGFCAGVSAAKDFIANEFEHAIRGAMISGHEAARLVRVCRGPELP